jgi:anti-sigma factor RsiW
MTMQELTCRELVELITDYLEDRLPTTERARFEAHLPNCSGCRHYLEQMRKTIGVVGTLSEQHLSTEARDELLSVFANWKKSQVE